MDTLLRITEYFDQLDGQFDEPRTIEKQGVMREIFEVLMIDGIGNKRCIGKEVRREVNVNSILMNRYSTNPNETTIIFFPDNPNPRCTVHQNAWVKLERWLQTW